MEYRKVLSSDSIKEIFELVYDGDPVIYHDLFGDFDTGLKVYGILFEDPKSIFYKSFYRVTISDDGKIIGVCTHYGKNLRWNPDIVKSAFMVAGVKIPESFYSVTQYFIKTYNYSHLQVAACNVCVRKEFRSKGVGSYMISKLLEEVGNQDIQLTVLKDNIPAIKLYEKFGFKIIEEFPDYGGHGKPDVVSYQMYRMVS